MTNSVKRKQQNENIEILCELVKLPKLSNHIRSRKYRTLTMNLLMSKVKMVCNICIAKFVFFTNLTDQQEKRGIS